VLRRSPPAPLRRVDGGRVGGQRLPLLRIHVGGVGPFVGGGPRRAQSTRRADHRRTASLSEPFPAEGAMSKGASGRTGGAVGLRGGAVERSGEGTREWTRAAPPRSCR